MSLHSRACGRWAVLDCHVADTLPVRPRYLLLGASIARELGEDQVRDSPGEP